MSISQLECVKESLKKIKDLISEMGAKPSENKIITSGANQGWIINSQFF